MLCFSSFTPLGDATLMGKRRTFPKKMYEVALEGDRGTSGEGGAIFIAT